MLNKCISLAAYLSSAVLFLLGLSKACLLVVAPGEVTNQNAFLSPMPNWLLAIISFLLELFVSLQIIKNRCRPRVGGLWLLWYVVINAICRVGMWMASPQSACHCLGLIGMLIGSGKIVENQVAHFILLILTLTALLMLFAKSKSTPIKPIAPANATQSLIMAALFIGVYGARADQIVQISGDIKSEYFNVNSVKINTGYSTFDVIRDGRGWQIATTQPHSDGHSIASDGETTYSLILDTNQTLPGNVGEIDYSNLPLDTPAEAIPWWFFVLTENASPGASQLPTPWTVPRRDAQAFFCRQEIAWSEAQPHLPASVAFFFDKTRVAAALNAPILLPPAGAPMNPSDIQWLLQDMQDNIKAGECLVTAWTNAPCGMFPERFEVRVYNALVDHKMKRNNVMRIHYLGNVHAIHLVDKISYLPDSSRDVCLDNRL